MLLIFGLFVRMCLLMIRARVRFKLKPLWLLIKLNCMRAITNIRMDCDRTCGDCTLVKSRSLLCCICIEWICFNCLRCGRCWFVLVSAAEWVLLGHTSRNSRPPTFASPTFSTSCWPYTTDRVSRWK